MSLFIHRSGLLKAASGAPPAFSPSDLSPMLWLEADDLSTLFQSNAGSTAVASDGDPVGYWGDKSGAGFHFTCPADDTRRPTYHTSGGLHWVEGDGSNDMLRRTAALGMYAAGACSIFIAMRANPATNSILFAERSNAGQAIYQMWARSTDYDDLQTIIRNDAGTFLMTLDTAFVDEGLDDTDFVAGMTDSGSTVIHYNDGTQVDSDSYTRSGSFTADRTSLFGNPGSGECMSARIYALVVVGRVIDSTERANLVTYLGNKMGLSL